MELKLYHLDNFEKTIGNPRTINGMLKMMRREIKRRGEKNPYTRISIDNNGNRLWIDYGSHFWFFEVHNITSKNLEELYLQDKKEKEKCKV